MGLDYVVIRDDEGRQIFVHAWEDVTEKKEVFGREILLALEEFMSQNPKSLNTFTLQVGEIPIDIDELPPNVINMCQFRSGDGEFESGQLLPEEVREKAKAGDEVFAYIDGVWRRVVTDQEKAAGE